jgi:pyruvate/2-oxoglutarate dehydrogenase complex dihydrolipoamide acyltransferase (E2) component
MMEIRIPKMGMSTVEVDVVKWEVQVGDIIEVGQPLVVVESEKAEMTIDAEMRGVMREIRVKEGETVEVGTVICRVEESV